MTASNPFPARARFDQFLVDLTSGVLERSGVRVPVQGQPLQVLRLLLQADGKVVTREELRKVLWPEDTFVDFELGVNTAVKKLRQALADPADRPKFIETLPRIGYRFLVPVEWVTEDGHKPVPETTGTSPNFRRLALVASLVFLLVAGAFVWVKLPSSPPMPRVVNAVPITKDGLRKADATVLVSDGTRLYFQEGSFQLNTGLVQVSTQGGETAGIPVSLQNSSPFDFSQSHSELLLGAGEQTLPYGERPLWVLPLPAGAPHRLGDILAHDACWSPDGRRLVFANGKDVFGAKADGSEVRKLASPDGSDLLFGIRFSPDGRRLRFSVAKGNVVGVMEMAADGSGLHRLPIDGGCCGRWSSDGKYYFYVIDRDVWVLSEQRSLFGKIKIGIPVQLTFGPITYGPLTPSVDGKELFVVGAQQRVGLVRYARDSKQFVPFLEGISAEELEVSPDGQWVTYTTLPESDLWRSKLDGTERLQLTFPPINAHEPRWSPDGKKILFTDFPSKIFVISADGGTPRQLMASDHPEFAGAGAWLPDGNSIVFGRHMGCPVFDNSCWGIYRLDLKTKEVSNVPGSEGMVAARLSHDGHYLTAIPTVQNKVMLYDLKTKRWSELARAGGSIVWSHNNQFVYLHLNSGADPSGAQVVRISVPDGKVQHILDLKGVNLGGPSPDWISLLPDDSPLLMWDKGTEEIYRLDLEYR